MKKLGVVLMACGALAACTSYEPDQDIAAETRREAQVAYHQDVGCPNIDDHEAYRKCVIATYYKGSPKTFVPAKLADGRSLAIVRNDKTTSFDEETNTYKTERVVVIETVETITGQEPKIIESKTQTEVIETPAPEPVLAVAEQPEPEVVVGEAVVDPQPEPVEESEKTWWETYQKEKPVEETQEPTCPCPDPNEPCPQCIDK